jgi:hypothetical protein
MLPTTPRCASWAAHIRPPPPRTPARNAADPPACLGRHARTEHLHACIAQKTVHLLQALDRLDGNQMGQGQRQGHARLETAMRTGCRGAAATKSATLTELWFRKDMRRHTLAA